MRPKTVVRSEDKTMVYKYHKEQHELECNKTRLRKPTEEEKKIMEKRRIMVHEKMRLIYSEEELDRLTFKPNK